MIMLMQQVRMEVARANAQREHDGRCFWHFSVITDIVSQAAHEVTLAGWRVVAVWKDDAKFNTVGMLIEWVQR